MDTEIARDPRNPLQEDHVQRILSACLQQLVCHYTLDAIEDNRLDFTGLAYSFDTMEQAQLERIAEKAGQTGKKVLWIGSAGLAQGLLQIQQRELPAMAVSAVSAARLWNSWRVAGIRAFLSWHWT